jgi:hypothetical protein
LQKQPRELQTRDGTSNRTRSRSRKNHFCRRQVPRYHPGRRAAVASSKFRESLMGNAAHELHTFHILQRLPEAKERFRNRRRLPDPNAFAKDLVWRYVWQ